MPLPSRSRATLGTLATIALASVAAVMAASSPAATKSPVIHAHRGGSVLDGKPSFPENTLPAFKNAALVEKAVLELDVKLTKDGVPVVIHDDSLDRTTNCTGLVKDATLAKIRKCRADVLGSPGATGLKTKPVAKPTVGISTLAEVLAFVKSSKATVNLEIKNLPTDKDWDPTYAYAGKVMDTVIASKVPKGKLIIQSFIPGNLDVAKQRMPGVATSILTSKGNEEAGLTIAKTGGYTWVSPSWPVSTAFVTAAHAAGKRVVPYTIDTRAAVRAAAKAGVDALITNDPVMARKALGT